MLHSWTHVFRTPAAHGGDGLLQLLPLSVCTVTDTNVDCGPVAANSFTFLRNQGGSVGDGEGGEASQHKNISFFWQQGAHSLWAQAAGLILQTQ